MELDQQLLSTRQWCKFMVYAWPSMAGGLACYLFVWLFLGLSGIYCCYEEVNYNKKTQLFKLKKLEEETKTENDFC